MKSMSLYMYALIASPVTLAGKFSPLPLYHSLTKPHLYYLGNSHCRIIQQLKTMASIYILKKDLYLAITKLQPFVYGEIKQSNKNKKKLQV